MEEGLKAKLKTMTESQDALFLRDKELIDSFEDSDAIGKSIYSWSPHFNLIQTENGWKYLIARVIKRMRDEDKRQEATEVLERDVKELLAYAVALHFDKWVFDEETNRLYLDNSDRARIEELIQMHCAVVGKALSSSELGPTPAQAVRIGHIDSAKQYQNTISKLKARISELEKELASAEYYEKMTDEKLAD